MKARRAILILDKTDFKAEKDTNNLKMHIFSSSDGTFTKTEHILSMKYVVRNFKE